MSRFLTLALAVSLCACAAAQTSEAPAKENEVRNALAAFIQAFDNLEWENFCAAFAEDATVFYPRAIPERATGRSEFERNFRQVFEQIRAGRTKGPFQDIQPRDLHIQIAGDVAVVTFHLDDRPGFVNRRTVILRNLAAGWKIIHLHASEVAVH